MSLVGYQPPTGTVPFKGGSFQVKGLSLEDVSVLVQTNLENMEHLWGVLDKGIGDGSGINVERIAGELVMHAPNFARTMIAIAATDEADFNEKLAAASRLTVAIQVEAVKLIGSLTFEEVGGVKKFLENLMFLKGTLTAPMAQVDQLPAKAD
jgi:hypothetical protein